MQTIINLIVSIFLAIMVLIYIVATVACTISIFADNDTNMKMFAIGSIVGTIGILSAIVLCLMKAKGLI